MARKQWYTIYLQNGEYKETIAKVKSKGLAYIVKKEMTNVYEKTEYIVKVE